MRIVFVVPHADLSGGLRVVTIYAQRLKRRGHEVHIVFTPLPRPTLRTRVRSLLRGSGWLDASRPGPSHLDRIDVELHCLDRFRPVLDGDVPDADVVVATWWETAEWVWRLSAAKGAKAYFLQHYEDWGGPVERVDATWRLPMHKIVVSEWLARLARDRFGITDYSHVPNAVDLQQFDAPERAKASVPTIGFMYSTSPFKGCDIAIAAVNRARQSVPSLQVRSFGSVQPTGDLPLPRGTSFVHAPEQTRIRDIYAGCDAWLFTSRTEGFGLPLLEAMACRTPVIATPAGAAPELLATGGGALLDSGDPDVIARAIVALCHLPEPEWRTLSAAARVVASRYSWDDSTRRFEAALELASASHRHVASSGPGVRAPHESPT